MSRRAVVAAVVLVMALAATAFARSDEAAGGAPVASRAAPDTTAAAAPDTTAAAAPDTTAAAAPDTTAAVPDSAVAALDTTTAARARRPRGIYGSGSLGLISGDYQRLSLQALVGYHFKPKFSAGGRVSYEYVRDKRYAATYSSHNFALGPFCRYRITPELYAHAEFAAANYDLHSVSGASERNWVPFLYLGGGYTKRIAPNVSAYTEVLVDVWRDDDSPYEDWQLVLNVGLAVGF
jgi:hypothetical protein